MPTPAIVRGSEHFSTVIYEGNGVGQRVGSFVPYTDNGSIANSCMFDGSSSYLYRSIPGTASNADKCSLSLWFRPTKRANNFGFLGTNGGTLMQLYFQTDNNIRLYDANGTDLITTREFKDSSKFYHFMVVWDTAQSTASDRIKMYIDGEQLTGFSTSTYPSQNADVSFNTSAQQIGRINLSPSGNYYYDGYIAEVNFADNQAYSPSDFGLTDTSTGRWIPKSLSGISYGNNGFRLQFDTDSNLGDDTSSVASDFTSSGIGTDHQRIDTPTQLFPNMFGDSTSPTVSEGGMNVAIGGSGQYEQIVANEAFGVATGKWYWEMRVYNKGAGGTGWKSDSNVGGSQAADTGGSLGTVYNVGSSGGFADGEWTDDYTNAYSNFSTFSAASAGDIVMFAIDLDNRKGYVGLNGTWFNSANPANGTGSIGLGGTVTKHAIGAKFYPMCLRLNTASDFRYNFGNNRTFSNAFAKSAVANTASSGVGFFKYTPPTDFLSLCMDNLPTTTQDRSDLVWIKSRDSASAHMLFDTTRGIRKRIKSDSTSAETTSVGTLEMFLKGGFGVGDQTAVNKASDSTVAWMWHANGGTTSANTDGSGATLASTIQANQTAGFSIVQVTAPGSPSGTYKIAHGLGAAPQWIIGKNLENSGGYNWSVYHHKVASDPATDYLELNTTDALADNATIWGDTAPTSSVFTVGTGVPLIANEKTIFYCWTEIEGYSKFGSYTGTGDANGPFIYLGFKPAVIITKNISGSYRWNIIDNKRDPFNPGGRWLAPDNTDDEDAYTGSYPHDFLSNGFKLRANTTVLNNSDNTFVYAAFAEHPFIGDGTNPCPAR